MKIVIDRDLCQGHAACMGDAPEVFDVDDDGTLALLQEFPPESLRKEVQLAAKYCPTGAISVLDTEG